MSASAPKKHKQHHQNYRAATRSLNSLTWAANTDSVLRYAFLHAAYSFKMPHDAKVESYKINHTDKQITIYCNDHFAAQPFREQTVRELKDTVAGFFKSPGYHVSIIANNYEVTGLIPNFYRSSGMLRDEKRIYKSHTTSQVVRNISKPYTVTAGLDGRNLVVSPSHGWYYNQKTERWEWQRPRLFQTVEDVLPYSICIPFLAPMLENAGANVYIPRERDMQIHEAIIDNDDPEGKHPGTYKEIGSAKYFSTVSPGFALKKDTLEDKENPFLEGTSRRMKTSAKETASISWTPDIPADGDYAVYISYKADSQNIANAQYRVFHSGGCTDFLINQKIGGSSWYYLGTFHFLKGMHKESGSVYLSNYSATEGYVSADAVRFGGGMSVVKKNGAVSGRPKFAEGARYWLQFAGMPDTLVYALNKDDDYKDDFQSRGEYADYLHGAPFGPNKDRTAGLHIPIDLCLSLHTDAGSAGGDTTVGTLAIFTIKDFEGKNYFPDSVSRLASRDLSDILQSQVVSDIRALYDSSWNRRELRNAEYSESARPNVPSLILELLAHQNFADMRYAQTPEFRFTVARSIYKGILKYLSDNYGSACTVQPLPPHAFSALLQSNNSVQLSWQPQQDSLEPTAKATAYVVYTAINNNGYDNGTLIHDTLFTIRNIKPGTVYRFKVTAVNGGGESFPTEELSAGIAANQPKQVLIINGFHRTSSPDLTAGPSYTGFLNANDEGVPFGKDVSFTGVQMDFNPDSPYLSNDAPGFGTSASDLEARVIAGNTFAYPFIHGKAILAAGYSFSSISDEAFMNDNTSAASFRAIDLIYGEEKTTAPPNPAYKSKVTHSVFPFSMQRKLESFLHDGGALFVSGSYIASDPFKQRSVDSSAFDFIRKTLHFSFNSDHASKNGSVVPAKADVDLPLPALDFNVVYCDSIYRVSSPGGLAPGKSANVILRYEENGFPAAIAFRDKYSVVAFGFPFETMVSEAKRAETMQRILTFLLKR